MALALLFAFFFTHFPSLVYAQTLRFRVVSWNVENLFDTNDDPLKADDDFLPNAYRRWNYTKYRKKLNDIACTLTAIGEWDPPALVGLCEVENDTVLRDLTLRSSLKASRYRYIMTHSPDRRGINVALLYQHRLFRPFATRSILVPPLPHCSPTRDLLHVSGQLPSGDTLDVFVCHLPSRSGGVKETIPYRMHAAKILRTAADSLLQMRLHPQIIIMGDFNDYPHDSSIRTVLEADSPPSDNCSPRKLYHLLARKAQSVSFGSYKYQGEWGLLDHLIVSGTLLDPSNSFFTNEENAGLGRLPFLLIKDKKYGGQEPFRTYKGMKYQGGISDHLPVYADFKLHIE